ncbi:hypothetical protein DAT35_32710 [Vitiosangium sp. GDMCC 1.1324]|nr:hypothetical protein DAT35_32710 [Vitiosangium sp. GDMCC 1.1324]
MTSCSTRRRRCSSNSSFEPCRSSNSLTPPYPKKFVPGLWGLPSRASTPSANVTVSRGMPGRKVFSEHFAHFVEQHGSTNIQLTPIKEYTWEPLEPGPSQHVG